MKVYFSPEYSGTVYLSPKRELLFNAQVVNWEGLLDLLCLHAGLHFQTADDMERLMGYYEAMEMYTKLHPEHLFAKSFQADGVAVAQVCLQWRDALVMAGWNGHSTAPTARMQFLQGVESLFHIKGVGDRAWEVLEAVRQGCALPQDLELLLPCTPSILPPVMAKLLTALEERGVGVRTLTPDGPQAGNLRQIGELLTGGEGTRVRLDEADKSFGIYRFADYEDAMRYLVTRKEKTEEEVWISRDTKSLDNWLRLAGKPAVGSWMKQVISPVEQLLAIGLRTLSRPLNILALLEWLYADACPLGIGLRRRLAEKIVQTGGYVNEDCKTEIDKYVDAPLDDALEGKEDRKQAEKRVKRRKELVDAFLPDMEEVMQAGDSQHLDVERVERFANHLHRWCVRRMNDEKSSEQQKEAFAQLDAQISALQKLMQSVTEHTIALTTLENWLHHLCRRGELQQYEAQQHGRWVVDAPGKVIDAPQETLWCDFFDDLPSEGWYDFLTSKEREELAADLELWGEDEERHYHQTMKLLPFLWTQGKLRLVVCERKGNGATAKHPILIRLEQQVENLGSFVYSPQPEKEHYRTVELCQNRIGHDCTQIQLQNGNLFSFPEHESPSSLELLFQYPLDYVMRYLVQIQPKGMDAMAPLYRTKGNVAHAVMARLLSILSPSHQDWMGEMAQRVDTMYDQVFEESLYSEGAILLLKENRIEMRRFKEELRLVARQLFQLMRVNELRSDCCEFLMRGTPLQKPDAPQIEGRADMMLMDKRGGLHVFDFKWSNNEKRYKKLLQENRAIQLELYKALAVETSKNRIEYNAEYFVMPAARLLSVNPLEGENAVTVEVSDERRTSLLAEIENSYWFRKEQLMAGVVEQGEGLPVEELEYGKQTAGRHLVPLNRDKDGNLERNNYSNNLCFKQ